MTLAEKIFTLRKRHGLSQDELAGELGVTRQAVYKWESGIASPEIDKLKSLSKLFDVSFDYLLNDEIDEYTNDKEKSDATPKKPAYRSVFRLGEKMLGNQPSIDRGYFPERKSKTNMSDAYFARRKKAAEEGMRKAGATEILFFSNRRTCAFFYDEVKKTIGFYYASAVQFVCPIENLAGFSFYGGNTDMVNSQIGILGIGATGFGIGSVPSAKVTGRGAIHATLLYHEGDSINEFPLYFLPFQDYMIFNFNCNRELIGLIENADADNTLESLGKIQLRLDALKDSAQNMVTSDTPDIDIEFYSERNKETQQDFSIFRQRVMAEINGVKSNTPKMEPKNPPIHKLSQEVPEKPNNRPAFVNKIVNYFGGVGKTMLVVLFIVCVIVSMTSVIPEYRVLLTICLVIGLIPARIANTKGRNFVLWWIYGTCLFLIALIHSLVISEQ